MHFLPALNVHLGGGKTISKDAMSKFFNNLSMQTLSKSEDAILIKFNQVKQKFKQFADSRSSRF